MQWFHFTNSMFLHYNFVFFDILGAILRLPIWGDPADDNCFDDESYWEVRGRCLQDYIIK